LIPHQSTMAFGSLVDAAVKATPAFVKACGQTAPLVSSAVFLSPIPTIKNVVDERDVGKLPLLPYSSMVVNAFMWMTYGMLRKDSKVWMPNAFGLFCGVNYFFQFQKYCTSTTKNLPGKVSDHFKVMAAFLTFTVAAAAFLPAQVSANLIGKVAVGVCVILFASPLAALKTVVQTKSAKSIPLPFTLTCILNCFLWTVYGVDIQDFNIYGPNFLGLLAALAQLTLIIIYGKGKPTQLPV